MPKISEVDSSVFMSGVSEDSIELYKASLLPRDQALLLKMDLARAEEHWAHCAEQSKAIFHHFVLKAAYWKRMYHKEKQYSSRAKENEAQLRSQDSEIEHLKGFGENAAKRNLKLEGQLRSSMEKSARLVKLREQDQAKISELKAKVEKLEADMSEVDKSLKMQRLKGSQLVAPEVMRMVDLLASLTF